ncbi:uncharacterized protein LOC105165894 [Sesamum indicum]|uniref:Uncharacterized protein LOC105165894 n=1 Tax=Sesamum indicum TaxID=4182 RepID=A0A6I9TJV6_SESIN|nr:uncharacterized protein LOC105165894 [Sesamum indicum]
MIRETTAITAKLDVKTVDQSKSWKDEIARYLREGSLPDDPIQAKRIKFKAVYFTLVSDQLYKRTVDGPLLKCLDDEKSKNVMKEIHEGSCENHSSARLLAQKVIRQGYVCSKMARDTREYVRKCDNCQRYPSLIH